MSALDKSAFEKMFEGISLCRERALDVPMLVLLYTLLDALAWAVYGDKMNGVKERFVRLCEQHLLARNNFQCSARELYAARCSILHTLGWESDLSRKGNARSFFYSFGTDNPDTTQQVLDHLSPGRFVGVRADELVTAAREALAQVEKEAATNEDLRLRLQKADGKRYRTLDSKISEQVFGVFLKSQRKPGEVA